MRVIQPQFKTNPGRDHVWAWDMGTEKCLGKKIPWGGVVLTVESMSSNSSLYALRPDAKVRVRYGINI